MNFVAHEDDDLLFMNPDIATSIASGNHVVTAFLTAGTSFGNDRYEATLISREVGILNAYAYMVDPFYSATTRDDEPAMLAHWRLHDGAPITISTAYGTKQAIQYDFVGNSSFSVSVVFLRLYETNGNQDLRTLWHGTDPAIKTVPCVTGCALGSALGTQTYTRDELIQMLAALMNRFHDAVPESQLLVNAQDSTGLYSHIEDFGEDWEDNPDHIAAANFVVSAFHRYHRYPGNDLRSLREYRGYNISMEPINLGDDEQIRDKRRAFYRYWVSNAEPGDTNSNNNPDDPQFSCCAFYTHWTERKYAVITLASANSLRGRLMNGADQCIRLDGALLHTGACTNAPEWEITTRNEIRLASNSSRCVILDARGAATVRSCLKANDSERQTLVLTSNGQIRTLGAGCLSGNSGSVRAVSCTGVLDENQNPLREAPQPENWTLLLSDPRLISTQFSDASEIDESRSYYRTISILNGQICLRRSGGVGCAKYDDAPGEKTPLDGTLESFAYWASNPPEYTNDLGWGDDSTGGTIAFRHLSASGALNVCGRGYYGIRCGTGEAASWWTDEFSTLNGWDSSPSYYGSIRLADVDGNGNADVCGRGYYGITCAFGTGVSFMNPRLMTLEYSNAQAWDPGPYGETIQFGDVDGDGRDDVCGRGIYGLLCGTSTPQGGAFLETHTWAMNVGNDKEANTRDLGDSDPLADWASTPAKYRSIRLVDINRDGFADVCGRGTYGIYCALSTGTAFERKRTVMPFNFTDQYGWNLEQYGSTLSFGNLDGDKRTDLCARGTYGMWCSEGP